MATRATLPPGGSTIDVTTLADPDAGWVNRRVYVERDIYELELERVFARGWLYLCHVSQLGEPGDYVTTFMGEDPVIVVRGADGIVRAFLNACRHRGMRVCRAEEGNTSFFRCPYHAWTYSNEGELRGVPKYRLAYEGVMQREDWGLVPVAKLADYQGLVFATWDRQAPDLLDYLGDFTFYLDLGFGRDPQGVEILSGAHKWAIDANWKHPSENFACDMYHGLGAHLRPAELGLMTQFADEGYEVSAGVGYIGHEITRPVSEDGDGDETLHGYWSMPNPYTYVLKEQRKAVAAKHDEQVARLVPSGHASIFPNFSFLDLENLRLVRVQQPLGPDRVMIHQWCCVDASLDPELKQVLRRQYELAFGPTGLLEQDDGENWRECQEGMRGWIGRRLDSNMDLGRGRERPASEILGDKFPGRGGGIWSEANQRQFFRHWMAFMGSDGWDELRGRLTEVSH
ncbi:MAG TPA: Rieske 2Fe-2S domain-containing protein [Solirubrobacteraceae bacterium]|jgi:3-phenylpropionate/trans-cinnamate dioxygenase alpha subunit|nr:Rieske 2Fe-2S domain-containing protein [Solirubrobacteraceae bacterium]